MQRAPGQIITFYSYKGGTGRSMALANVAWILASNGRGSHWLIPITRIVDIQPASASARLS